MANSLIAHNALREPRRLEPLAGRPEGNVRVLQWETIEDEATGLAGLVQTYLSETGSDLRDVLVLAPRRSIGYLIRDNLIGRGVLAHSYFFEEALENERAQERITLLNLLVNPDDRVALRCWLGFGHNGLAAAPYARFRGLYEADGSEPRVVLKRIQSGAVSFVGAPVLAARHAALEAELARLDGLEDEVLVNALFPDGDDEVRTVRRIAQLALETALEPLDAKALFNDIRTRIIYPEPPPAGEYVRVMSLHKSKGLTARLVVVAGCVEGWIPSLGGDLTGDEARRDLEEQRRLFYVALTRSTDALILSSFRSLPSPLAHRMQVRVQTRQGGRAYVQASRFLAELGPSAPAPRLG
jgi:superfamily I DNA/RNA helicase